MAISEGENIMMGGLYWILDGVTPVPTTDVLEWGRMFENIENRRVALTHFPDVDIEVSTVFIGTDHRFMDIGTPLLFETMAFGPFETAPSPFRPGETYTYRPESSLGTMDCYSTWSEAIIGHGRVVGMVRCALERKLTSSTLIADFVIERLRATIDC